MVTSICLITAALFNGQIGSSNGFLLGPRLVRGLELDYQGVCIEENLIPRVTNQRRYSFATRIMVLESTGGKWQVALMTALGLKNRMLSKDGDAPSPVSVRLELADVDRVGKVSGDVAMSLDGLPTIDRGPIIEFPKSVLRAGSEWISTEPNRPPLIWKLVGQERCNGAMCLKLVGVQQSAEWKQPRADRMAWRRKETVWLSPQFGYAYKVERIVERRAPARTSATQRTIVRYEMNSPLRLPPQMYQARKKDILQSVSFRGELTPLLQKPALYRSQLDRLLGKIDFYLKYQRNVTPYRQAILQVKRDVERAKKGEFVNSVGSEPRPAPIRKLRIGQQTPDFVVNSLTSAKSVNLYRRLGAPILMVYYRPNSAVSKTVLGFADTLKKNHGKKLVVFAMAVSPNNSAKKEHQALKLSFPILDGRVMHQMFGVDATPRIILLDAKGIVRGMYTGWGAHTESEVTGELEQWLRPTVNNKKQTN